MMFVFLTNGNNRFGKFLTARRLVLGDRHIAQEHFHFRQDALGNRLTRYGKGGGMWRVTVHDALDVFTVLVDLQVQQGFAGRFLEPAICLPVISIVADIVRLQGTLSSALWECTAPGCR